MGGISVFITIRRGFGIARLVQLEEQAMQYYAEKVTEFRIREALRGQANQAFVQELRGARKHGRGARLQWVANLVGIRPRDAKPADCPAPTVGRWSW
jgi:hypothetical protein